jgi:hypothetical protein
LVQVFNRHGLAMMPLTRAVGPLLLTLVVCLASTLLNSRGLGLWPYMVTELSFRPNGKYIHEWMPLITDGVWSWSAIMVYIPLAIAVGFGIIAQIRGKRIFDIEAWQWLASCVPLTVMAFASNRHAPVLIMWLTPLLGLVVAAALEGKEGKPGWSVAVALLWAVALVPSILMTSLVIDDPSPHITQPKYARAPEGLVAFLRQKKITGNLYAPLGWGCSLTWETYPNIHVAMDGRNVTLFAPEDVQANLLFYYEPNADLDTPLHYSTDYLALPAEAQMLARVEKDRRWEEVFRDDEVVLFRRATAQETGTSP